MRRLLALVLALTAAAVVGPAVPVGAGVANEALAIELLSPVEPLTLGLTVDSEITCEDGEFRVLEVIVGDGEIEPLSVTQDPADPNAATVVLPSDTSPGSLYIAVECTGDPEPDSYDGRIELGVMPVTKVVEGAAPADATFTVHVHCTELPDGTEPVIDVDLGYGPTGGVRYVYFDDETLCQITEPNNGGATSTTISPEEVVNLDPDLYPVTVTNTFVSPAVLKPRFTG